MIAGIDTHKDTLAVAVIDAAGRALANCEVANTEVGFASLLELLETHQVCRVGIEGSGNFGRAVAVHMVVRWQPGRTVAVVEVPTLMTARERRAQLGKGKTDPVDAVAIARITAREQQLPPVRLTVGPAADLRALLDYREDLTAERTAFANRVHAELAGLRPGYQQQIPSLTTQRRIKAAVQLVDGGTSVRATLTRRRLERVLAIDTETGALTRQISMLVGQTNTTLTTTYGVGPLIAARFIAEVVDVRRYPNRDAFASANGTAPLPASSGRTVRHRFNPGGNRQLNRAFYTIALTQIRGDTEGRAYYQRTRAGKDQHGSPPLPQTAAVGPDLRHHAPQRRPGQFCRLDELGPEVPANGRAGPRGAGLPGGRDRPMITNSRQVHPLVLRSPVVPKPTSLGTHASVSAPRYLHVQVIAGIAKAGHTRGESGRGTAA